MASDTKHLEITLETKVASVNLAEEMCLRVAEAAGFGEDDCYRIGMSVREGVINAFHYGNKERPDKKIHLAVDLTADKMIIHVLDEGAGFKLSDVPDPLAEENLLSTSGRGIFLMRAFMDEFDVVSGRTGGAEIVMSKKLPAPGSTSPNGQGVLDDQRKKILLNLADVDYIDSSGIGELVSGFTAVKNQSGDLKLLHLTKKVRDLLQITKLYTVFDVFTDENTAVRSFG